MERNKKLYLSACSKASYRIEIEGKLTENLSDYFSGMSLSYQSREDHSIVTCLTGQVQDQAALMTILNVLSQFNFPILLLECIGIHEDCS